MDSFSTDRTREIARGYGARVVLCNGRRSKARNVGASVARGEFIFSVDSDMELMPDVVNECVAKSGCGADALIVPEVSVGEGFWAECKALEKTCYIGDNIIEASRFFRRSVFESIGGYDSELEAGEDWDLNQRISKAKCRIGRIHEFIKHHEGRLRLRDIMLRKRFYGKTVRLYQMKHPKEAKQQLTLIRPAFVRNWRKLAKDPIHASGMFFMKLCEFNAGCLEYLLSNNG